VSQKKKNHQSSNNYVHDIYWRVEHARLRPGWYFGGNDTKALNNLVDNLFECVMHQARQHICSSLTVSILGPQTLQICDNGEGIPPYKDGETDKHHLEYLLQYVGSDFISNWDLAAKGIRWGMDRLTSVNAVSLHMHVEVKREGALWEQHYSQGRKTSEITRVRDLAGDEESGTSLTFTVDNEIFPDAAFDAPWIEQQLADMAYLLPGLNITFENTMTGHQSTHYHPDGIAQYMSHLNGSEIVLYPPMLLHSQLQSVPWNARRPQFFEIDMAMQFLAAPHGGVKSFAKALAIEPLGQHTAACFDALTDMLIGHSSIIQHSDLPDLFLHAQLVISLWHPGLMFESWGSRVLLNRDIYQPIYEELSLALLLYFKDHPDCIPQLEALALEHRQKITP
jgi:DNA gyrase subunit B